MKAHRARILAMQALYQLEFNKRTVHDLEKFDWVDYEIPLEERDFSINLVKGVLENTEIIDRAIQEYSKNWKIERISPVSRAILRLSIFQLMKMLGVPYKAVIDEAIKLAKAYGEEDSARFINGVLDAVYKNECKK